MCVCGIERELLYNIIFIYKYFTIAHCVDLAGLKYQ